MLSSNKTDPVLVLVSAVVGGLVSVRFGENVLFNTVDSDQNLIDFSLSQNLPVLKIMDIHNFEKSALI